MKQTVKPKWTYAAVLLAACIAGLPTANAADESLVVKTSTGLVRGIARDGSGARFLGIPFAQPPVGERRWREPLPAKAWSGVRDAKTYSLPCAQPHLGDWNRHDADIGQEDCLYLNVITPAWPKKGLLPVMFWLHGGANEGGSGMSDLYTAGTLADHGVIVVTVNYRLGVFGFLAHPELTRESVHHTSGNYGVMDQMLALKWVIANIRNFGGDARNITVFGQSAGAFDTGILMVSSTKGLFQKAIKESAPMDLKMISLKEAESAGEKFAAALEAPKGAGQIAFLRRIPSGELISKLTAHEPHPRFIPIVDGWLLTRAPVEVFAAGEEAAIPLLSGTTTRELGGSQTPEQLSETVTKMAGRHASEALKEYGLAQGTAGTGDPVYGTVAEQVAADIRFRCPAVVEARWHTAAHHATFQYEFNHPVPGRPNAIHSTELSFVFGFYPKEGDLAGPYTAADWEFADMLERYITNFARTGNPNGAGLPTWPEYGAAGTYVKLTREGSVEEGKDLRGAQCRLFQLGVEERIKK